MRAAPASARTEARPSKWLLLGPALASGEARRQRPTPGSEMSKSDPADMPNGIYACDKSDLFGCSASIKELLMW